MPIGPAPCPSVAAPMAPARPVPKPASIRSRPRLARRERTTITTPERSAAKVGPPPSVGPAHPAKGRRRRKHVSSGQNRAAIPPAKLKKERKGDPMVPSRERSAPAASNPRPNRRSPGARRRPTASAGTRRPSIAPKSSGSGAQAGPLPCQRHAEAAKATNSKSRSSDQGKGERLRFLCGGFFFLLAALISLNDRLYQRVPYHIPSVEVHEGDSRNPRKDTPHLLEP